MSAKQRAGAVLAHARWDSEQGLSVRREARTRKISEMLAKFPVTRAEADAIRALLPPVPTRPAGNGSEHG